MAPLTGDARAQAIANNRSLRTIKNELESLCERDVISDDQYAAFMKILPAEASLNPATGPPAPPARNNTSSTTTSSTVNNTLSTLSTLSLHDTTPATSVSARRSPSPQPPAYDSATTQHKELAHVTALYKYSDADTRDLDFEPGDHISVTEYLNPEWWQGQNIRTGETGIFPKNYVKVEDTPSSLASSSSSASMNEKTGYYGNEKSGAAYGNGNGNGGAVNRGYGNGPPKSNDPYAGPVPPMGVAEGGRGEPGKGQEMGKKFGKKLGNAAIFGAGATIGGKIVNGIF